MKSESEGGTYNHNIPSLNPQRKTSVVSGGVPLRKSNPLRRLSTKKTAIKDLNNSKVILISVIFVMVLAPFNGFQNVLHELLKEYGYPNLGLLSLAVFYLSLGLGSFVTPQHCKKYNYKYTFFIALLPMVLFFASQWLLIACTTEKFSICATPAIYLICFACALLAGIGTSLLWITMTVYVTECSNPLNKGKMFGIFNIITQFTQIIGISLACVLLSNFGASFYFEVIILCCLAGTILALLLQKPETDVSDMHLLELSNFTAPVRDSLLPQDEERLLPQSSDVGIPRMENFTQRFFWKCLGMQKTLIFYPLFLTSAYNVSLFVTYLASDVFEALKFGDATPDAHFSQKFMKVLVVFLALGLGEILADKVFSSKINTDKKEALSLTYKIFLICGILHIIANSIGSFVLYIPIGFFYGLGDGGSQLVIGGLISMKFLERFEPFTCFRIIYFTSLGGFFILHLLLIKGAATVSFVIFIVLIGYAWVNNYKFFTTLS